jgi:PAT family beta-lactamase induction signal transducer AmpG
MIIVGLIMAALTIYNYFLHLEQKTPTGEKSLTQSFGAVFASFFSKQIGIVLAFILLFRLGESHKNADPFLIDDISVGGMGLTTQDVGIIYGTFGVLALTIGGIIWNCNL